MVFVADEGSEFEAPIEFVWKYIFDGSAHDRAHTTTRNPKFEKVSEVTFLYASERLLRGAWRPDRLRISMFPPVSVVTEWIEGVLAGSRFVYLYRPAGERTRIDVYGEFQSPTLSAEEVSKLAHEFLDSEFQADAPAIREAYRSRGAGVP